MSSENISMTRISDLPLNSGSNHAFSQPPPPNLSENSNMYMPLNPHPNPYGIPDQRQGGDLPPPPQQQYPYSQQQNPSIQNQVTTSLLPQQNMQPESPEYRLPQRDIPMDITDFTHDEQIQPNYIPKPKVTADYVEKHEQATQSKVREYLEQQKKDANRNEWLDQLYMPVLLSFLFFIFQLPIVNTLIFKRFSFLSIYKEDGNFNVWGLLMKSSLFATTFFLLQKSSQSLIDML
jgi:hypothetical protein